MMVWWLLLVILISTALVYLKQRRGGGSDRITITAKLTPFNTELLKHAKLLSTTSNNNNNNNNNNIQTSNLPSIQTYEYPEIWGTNFYAQVISSSLFRSNPKIHYEREVIPCPEFLEPICLDWAHASKQQNMPWDTPTLIILPGITGSIDASYVNHFVKHCSSHFRLVVYSRPGCDPRTDLVHYKFTPNTHFNTISAIIDHVATVTQQKSPILVAGFSQGGQNISRYLTEFGENVNRNLIGCLSIGNPFDSTRTVDALEKYPIIDRAMAKSVKSVIFRNHKIYEQFVQFTNSKNTPQEKYSLHHVNSLHSLKHLDQEFTKRIHEWNDVVEDYYKPRSVFPENIPNIHRPIVYLHAIDDPIVPQETIPKHVEHDNVIYLTTKHGSHCAYTLKHSSYLPFISREESLMDTLGKDILLALVHCHKQSDILLCK